LHSKKRVIKKKILALPNDELNIATVHYALPIYNAEPTASVAEGYYDSAQTVTLNCSTAKRQITKKLYPALTDVL